MSEDLKKAIGEAARIAQLAATQLVIARSWCEPPRHDEGRDAGQMQRELLAEAGIELVRAITAVTRIMGTLHDAAIKADEAKP